MEEPKPQEEPFSSSEFDQALARLKKETELREGIAQKVEQIKNWVAKNGEKVVIPKSEENPLEEQNGEYEEHQLEFWSNGQEPFRQRNGNHKNEFLNTIFQNGEEEHEYQAFHHDTYIPDELQILTVVIPDDLETMEATGGRELAIEHRTPTRTLSLNIFADDEDEEDPFRPLEKSVTLKSAFHVPGEEDYIAYLPRTALSQLTPDQAVIVDGILSSFLHFNPPDTPATQS